MAETHEAPKQLQMNSELKDDKRECAHRLGRGCRRIKLDRSKQLRSWRLLTEVRAPSDPLPPARPLPTPVKEPPANDLALPPVPYREPDPAEPDEI